MKSSINIAIDTWSASQTDEKLLSHFNMLDAYFHVSQINIYSIIFFCWFLFDRFYHLCRKIIRELRLELKRNTTHALSPKVAKAPTFYQNDLTMRKNANRQVVSPSPSDRSPSQVYVILDYIRMVLSSY
jgi:hypothetical protein